MTVQMELIERTTEEELREELATTKAQLTNLRRGLFGRYDKLVNEFTELQDNMHKIQVFLNMSTERVEKDGFFMYEESNEREILDIHLSAS